MRTIGGRGNGYVGGSGVAGDINNIRGQTEYYQAYLQGGNIRATNSRYIGRRRAQMATTGMPYSATT